MTIIYFLIVLCVTIMVHELGHFLFAKKYGVYVYEFCLGMGPKLFSKKKGETDYSIRLFPIGGFVSMAGEDLEEDSKIPKNKQLCNKSWIERFMTLIAGIMFNIIFAIILLFIVGLFNGSPVNPTKISHIENIDNLYPISSTNIEVGDMIKKINGNKVSSSEMIVLEIAVNSGEIINLEVEHKDKSIEVISVKPVYVEKDGQEGYSYGFSLSNDKERGFVPALKYSIIQTKNLINQMGKILFYLVTGKLSLNNLSGPVGIYSIVGSAAKAGFLNIIYLIAYLCINVAIINLIPIPAFDGGRILFLIIEKIKGSKVNPKVENTIHTVGFILLMALMIFVTYNDIIRLI